MQRLTAMFDKSVVEECENAEIHNSLTTMAAATTTSSVDSQIEIFVQEVLVKKIIKNLLCFIAKVNAKSVWEFRIKVSFRFACIFRMYRCWRKRSIVSSFTMKTPKMNARRIFSNK